MSSEVRTWAEKQSVGDSLAKAVLCALANWADPEGRNCFPSVTRIAAVTELSVRTVQRKFTMLEERGLIRRVPRTRQHNASHTSNEYEFPAFAEAAAGGDSVTPGGGDSVTPGGGDRLTPGWCHQVSPPETNLKGSLFSKENNDAPRMAKPRRRSRSGGRATAAAQSKPVVTQMPAEGFEATQFRDAACRLLGNQGYINLIQRCNIARVGDDLLIIAPSEVLCNVIRERAFDLGPLARQVGCQRLVVETRPKPKVGFTDPKVADAARQLDAIRGRSDAERWPGGIRDPVLRDLAGRAGPGAPSLLARSGNGLLDATLDEMGERGIFVR